MRRDTLVVLTLAGALHLLAFGLALGDPAFASTRFDETDYLALAGLIPDPLAGAHADFLSPGFVGWVRLLAAIGMGSVTGIVVANCVAGTSTVVLTYLVARRCAGRTAAAIAAMLLAICGPVLFYACKVLPDTLLATTTIATTWCWIRQRERPRPLAAVGFAALAVAMISLRGTHAVLALVMTIDLGRAAWRRRRVHDMIGVLVGVVLMSMALRLAGVERVLATSGPINFVIGNGEGATGTWRAPPGLVVHGESARGLAIAADEGDAARGGEFGWRHAVSELGHDPQRWARLVLRKAELALGRDELPDNRFYTFERRLHPLLRVTPDGLVLLVLGTCGLVAMATRRRGSTRAVGLLGLLVPCTTLLLFYVLGRYRVPWFPFLAIGTAVLVDTARRAVHRRRRGTLVVLAAALAVLGTLGWTPPRVDDGRAEFLRGFDLHRAGAVELAIPHYERALRRAGTTPALAAEITANLLLARRTVANSGVGGP